MAKCNAPRGEDINNGQRNRCEYRKWNGQEVTMYAQGTRNEDAKVQWTTTKQEMYTGQRSRSEDIEGKNQEPFVLGTTTMKQMYKGLKHHETNTQQL